MNGKSKHFLHIVASISIMSHINEYLKAVRLQLNSTQPKVIVTGNDSAGKSRLTHLYVDVDIEFLSTYTVSK